MIAQFRGEHFFLSNFAPAVVRQGDVVFRTLEHAYQAAKTDDTRWRKLVQDAETAAVAKQLGRRLPARSGWNLLRVGVMRELLAEKFADPMLKAKLLATGDEKLVEGNGHGDRFWGQCPVGVGQNMLGELLMALRVQLAAEPQAEATRG